MNPALTHCFWTISFFFLLFWSGKPEFFEDRFFFLFLAQVKNFTQNKWNYSYLWREFFASFTLHVKWLYRIVARVKLEIGLRSSFNDSMCSPFGMWRVYVVFLIWFFVKCNSCAWDNLLIFLLWMRIFNGRFIWMNSKCGSTTVRLLTVSKSISVLFRYFFPLC